MTSYGIRMLGQVVDVLVAPHFNSIVSQPAGKIECRVGEGVKFDRHAGRRLADSREHEFLRQRRLKGTHIANLREFSAVSVEDLQAIGQGLDIGNVPPGLLGENLIIDGIPSLSKLPMGTMLFFRKDKANARASVLMVMGENEPCTEPGLAIQRFFPKPLDLATKFPRAAHGRRGVVGIVYASGTISKGDEVIVCVPNNGIYVPLPSQFTPAD